jgi:hypothetical protein
VPTKSLPVRPDLRHLRFQVEDLLRDRVAGAPAVLQRIREFHPRFTEATDLYTQSAPFTRADAYLTIAREYGYSSWARLRRVVDVASGLSDDRPHHRRIENVLFRRAVEYLDDGNSIVLRDHLRQHPQLVRERVTFEGENYFTRPSLLEFIAENPVRNDCLPPNIVNIAEVIIDAGADKEAIDATLTLVCSGKVARECGVQTPLVEFLCARGATANAAMIPALVHAEFAAAEALLRCGADVNIAVAAGFGRITEVHEALGSADAQSRQRALALAAQHGHSEIVTLLLESGEDPNRYNPVGYHSHSTPLHQAALAGHRGVVQTLIEHGARTNLRDTLFNGTALEWAEYGKHDEVVEYLRRYD